MTYQNVASAGQVRMARVGLRLTFVELATRADIATATLQRVEDGGSVRPRTLKAVQEALEAAGARFIEDASHVGVMLPREGASEA